MGKRKDNGGCGLAVICLLIIIAIGKCSGGSPTVDEGPSTPSITPLASTVETMVMYVASASLNCRAEPEPASRVVEQLGRGDRVEARETQGNWAKLDRIDQDCWVAQRFLSENEPEPEPAGRSAALYSPPAPEPTVELAPRRSAASCGIKWKCGQMDSCAEAYHYLNDCGVGRLDGDGDGVPCESIC
ncbi:hypothetical protein C7E20_05715 [Sphingobium sp. AEW4]|nr:hypothetical protein C7E20_05715 [Sphingobium sp. AEW4]